jgi:hypothetical protein
LQDWVQEVLILLQNQPLILPLMGHLILSTKQELNYGGVRTISYSTSF